MRLVGAGNGGACSASGQAVFVILGLFGILCMAPNGAATTGIALDLVNPVLQPTAGIRVERSLSRSSILELGLLVVCKETHIFLPRITIQPRTHGVRHLRTDLK